MAFPYASPAARGTSDETAAVYGAPRGLSPRHAQRNRRLMPDGAAWANRLMRSSDRHEAESAVLRPTFTAGDLTAVKWQTTRRRLAWMRATKEPTQRNRTVLCCRANRLTDASKLSFPCTRMSLPRFGLAITALVSIALNQPVRQHNADVSHSGSYPSVEY